MSHDYGFMKITPGPLYVYITQGSSGVYIEKREMVVDGSESYDPDFFAQKGNPGYSVTTRDPLPR